MSNIHVSAFAGLHSVLESTSDANDVIDDINGEQETIPDLTPDDATTDATTADMLVSQWKTSVTGASKGVTEKTDVEYRRLMHQCAAFLMANNLITKAEDFFCTLPPPDAPLYITAWIMDQCDEIKLDGSRRSPTEKRGSYVYAQKMRASMTYAFGRIYGLGSQSWQKSEVSGRMIGNPSVSESVATYMMSLRNRKVHSGEVATSARAITPEILEKLYDINHLSENWQIKDYAPGCRFQKPAQEWGGGMARRALQAIYTIAFLCLLRADEVLNIQAEHIEFLEDPPRMVLTLPYRKTHQDGGIKPFYLYALPKDEEYLCPVRAMSEWIAASRITQGYLFRELASGERPSQNNRPTTSEQFLELFRNNLLDIEIDPSPYGTHSFRRGGCQYLAAHWRWNLRWICEWGGWSTDFSNLTIVKYLISSV